MTGRHAAVLALVATTMLAGWGRLGMSDMGGPAPAAQYEPLPAAPTKPVTQGSLQPLPPVPGQPGPGMAGDMPPPGAPGPVAAVDPGPPPSPEKAPPIGRTEVLGAWKIASGTDSCQLFMTLTTWSGGYRANTRGCTSPQLQRISAWDLSGKQVALKGADGSIVATLYGAGPERFSGQTSERLPVSVSR